ncbi:MAG: hypothetical protein HYR90_04205 [Candidatus Andersenbacteria bacterium]|nr:hypothetical protein [Candidatus Andersenbacteria bacterium]
MTQKVKIFLLIGLLFFAMSAHAVTIAEIPSWIEETPKHESLLAKIWRCKFRISCYRQKLGVTITTIAATDRIRDSRTTINDNFTNLNSGKIENSTTSVAAITALPNLVTVGALSSGSLASGFTTVTVGLGGTGSTTLASNQILLGNGTGALTVVNGFGASGQFLTSNGSSTAPRWTTSSIDTALSYTWTGNHSFTNATATLATTTNATTTSLQVGQLASTTLLITGSLGVGVATTAASTTEIGGNLQVRGVCTSGCGMAYEVTICDFRNGTGAEGVAMYTHTGDTSETQVYGSDCSYNPSNFTAGMNFRMEYTGGVADGTNVMTLGLATTTAANIIGTTLTGFTSSVGRTFQTTSTFSTSVMPAATQTLFCSITLSDGSKTGQIRGCRLVGIITR